MFSSAYFVSDIGAYNIVLFLSTNGKIDPPKIEYGHPAVQADH